MIKKTISFGGNKRDLSLIRGRNICVRVNRFLMLYVTDLRSVSSKINVKGRSFDGKTLYMYRFVVVAKRYIKKAVDRNRVRRVLVHCINHTTQLFGRDDYVYSLRICENVEHLKLSDVMNIVSSKILFAHKKIDHFYYKKTHSI